MAEQAQKLSNVTGGMGSSSGSSVDGSRAIDSFSLPLETGIAPSFPGIFRISMKASSDVTPGPPELTESDDHFEIIRELGRGASGVVYLARQVALNRQVALKVTYNVGSEARSMANLEHPNIVQVFSETISNDGKLRLICMQYVPGITLADLLQRLQGCERAAVNGFTIIELIAETLNSEVPEDYVNVHSLKNQNYVETVCSLGIRIALALEHSHRQAVIHRDIKPANILINREGQPLLADFSLSLQSLGGGRSDGSVFGGTLAYMAPEHLDALRPASGVDRDAVDERSDIYSLGLVLYELFSLEEQAVPYASQPVAEVCQQLADQRRAMQPSLAGEQDGIRTALNWTLHNCLQPNPADRFQRAGEIAVSLQGCQTLAGIIRNLPATNRWTRILGTSPAIALFFVGFIPNAIAIAIGIAYAFASPRVANISDEGRAAFAVWCVGYTIAGSGIMLTLIVFNFRKWMPRPGNVNPRTGDARSLRQGLLRFLSVAIVIELLVWLPGLFVKPGIVYWNQNVPSVAFVVEIVIAYGVLMLVAASLTYFVMAFIVVRAGYPFLWDDVRNLRATSVDELRGIPQQLRIFHWLVGAVPLAGAISVILAGANQFPEGGIFGFRILGIGLIIGGLLGLVAVGAVRAMIERTLELFTGKNA